LLPFSTSDFHVTVSYQVNPFINKPNPARLPSLNPKQSEISPLNGDIGYNLPKMLFSTSGVGDGGAGGGSAPPKV